jgi:hypothetical protein
MNDNITVKIDSATMTDAKDWNATQEQFTFCVDFLEISAHRLLADDYVNALEDKFEELLNS